MLLHADDKLDDVVHMGRAPEPTTMQGGHRPPDSAPMNTEHYPGFSAWLYDVHEVQDLCYKVAARFRHAEQGYHRVADDAAKLSVWERVWAALRSELEQACRRPRQNGKLLEIDYWTCYAIKAQRGPLLGSLHQLWQHWGDRLETVRTRDPESILNRPGFDGGSNT